MLKKLARSTVLAFSALFGAVSNVSLAQSTFVSIPEALQGLYTLEMVNASPLSPIQNTSASNSSDDILLYVTAYGELCTKTSNTEVQLLSSAPVLQGGLSGTVRWDVAASDLSFSLNINQVPFVEFNLTSTAGSVYGQLKGGAPTFDNGSCGSPPLNTSAANSMFSLAEANFPTLFPSSSFNFNQIGSGFDVFRYYQSTDIYLAVRDEVVYARGGDFGDDFIVVGDLEDLLDDINTMLVPNRIDAFYRGTYLLELTETQTFSPVEDGTELTFVVTQTGQLCVGELALSFPVISGTTAIWNNSNGNLRYTVDLTRDDDPATFDTNLATGEFSFQSLGGTTYGLFTGDKISLSTECGDAKGTAPDLTNINTLFGLIEQKYPTVFPAGPQTYNQKADGFTYRYYFDSQVFVAVKAGVVYLNGGEFGNNLEPVAYGTLTNVLAQLNNAPVSATFPASSAGTYAMSFSSATTFSPFTDGTSAQVVVDALGNLCLDGVSLGQPFARQASPNLAFWESADAGLSISADLNALTTTTMSLSVGSTGGLTYSTLSGDRTSLVTGCGSSTAATDMSLAKQLFGLAEQYYASLFPASVLSFNQINGNAVRRYYPATGMTLNIEAETVSVKGGGYGSVLVPVGQLSSLIAQIISANTPAAPIYDLHITGTGEVVVLNSLIHRTVDIKHYDVARPDTADSAAMNALIKTSLRDLVREIDSTTISLVSNTATELVFSVALVSDTVLPGNSTERDFSLVFTLRQR
jgi:hypothetical protein